MPFVFFGIFGKNFGGAQKVLRKGEGGFFNGDSFFLKKAPPAL